MRRVMVGIVLIVALATLGGCTPAEPGTIHVRVGHWPACPVTVDVTRLPAACEHRDLPGVRVSAMESGEVVAEDRTDDDGSVFLQVPPGTYFVHVGEVLGLRRPDPLLLDVVSGQQTGGIITYESGVRFDGDVHRP